MLIASFVGCLVWIGYNELFVGGRTPESVEEISDWIKSVEYHGEPPVRILQIEPTWRPRSPAESPSGTAAGSERCRDFRVDAPLPAGGWISV